MEAVQWPVRPSPGVPGTTRGRRRRVVCCRQPQRRLTPTRRPAATPTFLRLAAAVVTVATPLSRRCGPGDGGGSDGGRRRPMLFPLSAELGRPLSDSRSSMLSPFRAVGSGGGAGRRGLCSSRPRKQRLGASQTNRPASRPAETPACDGQSKLCQLNWRPRMCVGARESCAGVASECLKAVLSEALSAVGAVSGVATRESRGI